MKNQFQVTGLQLRPHSGGSQTDQTRNSNSLTVPTSFSCESSRTKLTAPKRPAPDVVSLHIPTVITVISCTRKFWAKEGHRGGSTPLRWLPPLFPIIDNRKALGVISMPARVRPVNKPRMPACYEFMRQVQFRPARDSITRAFKQFRK